MKQILVLLIVLSPFAGMAQKEIKPSIPKAEKALRDGKIDEAKAIIDLTTSDDATMKNKKGEPSKNAAKAWYLKGVIYSAIDTTSKAQFKSLDANAFATAKESFEKAKQIDPKATYFLTDANGFPVLFEQVNSQFAQKIFNSAIVAYDAKDYKTAFAKTEQTLYYIPEDTTVLMNAGVYFGPAANEFDKSIDYMKQYLAKGGKSSDPYIMLFSIYSDKKNDLDKALEIIKEAQVKFPNNPDFARSEFNIYIKQNKLPEAKVNMEKQAAADPTDKESRYYLGVINMDLKDYEAARKWYEEAIKIDPTYFEPTYGLAEVVHMDAKKVKQEMNQLGIKPEEKKKKLELDKIYVEKLKTVVPYFEKAEKLNPEDPKTLDNLLDIYRDLGNDAQVARIEKKMKGLGLLD